MVKYFFKRFFRGCISVIIAIALIMMMVFSWLDATLIFAEDEQYVKLSNNQRTLYMYQKWEEYDYLDYVPYTDWLNQLVSAGELSEEERSEAATIGRTPERDSEEAAGYIERFTAEYEAKEYAGFMATLVAIFPTNMWKAFTEANMLQVIVIALLFGGSILAAGEKSKLVRDMVTSAYAVVERLMEFIISLSPIGVFTYMTWVVATQGAEILGSLALVILCAYIGYILHAVLVYSVSAKAFAGISPVKFFKNASAAMIFAFTSTSSAATLPVSKECADALGAEDDISSFVLPLGATINMDGTAIYQCVATVFLATCAGMQLTLSQMILIVVTATLASIGTAGTPGAGMIMLAMVLEAIGIPVAYIGLIVAVDRLFDMGRTCLNVTGDIACSLCVTKWESKKK